MRDFFEEFGIILFVLTSVFLIAGAFIAGADMYNCYGFEKATGRPTKYTGFTCYVDVGEGKFLPKDYVLGKVYELRQR